MKQSIELRSGEPDPAKELYSIRRSMALTQDVNALAILSLRELEARRKLFRLRRLASLSGVERGEFKAWLGTVKGE